MMNVQTFDFLNDACKRYTYYFRHDCASDNKNENYLFHVNLIWLYYLIKVIDVLDMLPGTLPQID